MNTPPRTDAEWEALFAPYDEDTYAAALAELDPGDMVLDIGAGDFRFAKRAAMRAHKVIGIEQHVELLPAGVPENLTVIWADAREYEFPEGITAAVLLMRHCRHFSLYVSKLERAGCKRMITNARWGTGVEVFDLTASPIAFDTLVGGWFACRCGNVGYKPVESSLDDTVVQVVNCPRCD